MNIVKETPYTKQTETKINVIDSIMGSGKTSWAIQYMNEANSDKNFIFITPLLSEVQRVKESVTSRKFIAPENEGKGKFDNLKKLLINEHNIVSTHALFQKADDEIIELLRIGNYTLILDEVMDVIDQYKMEKDDFKLLIDNNMVSVEKNTGLVCWNDESEYQETRYNEIKPLAKTENLYFFENTILFWTFPVSVFNAFEEVYIMTYLFQHQEQRYYYDMYNVSYSYKAVQKLNDTYVLVNHSDKEPYDKSLIKSLINIYDGKLNNIGEEKNAFSFSWFKKESNKHLVDKLNKNIYSYFRNNVRTPAKLNMWTCFKDDIPKLKGKGYSKGYVPFNSRATNTFKDKVSLAYVVNRFMNPYKLKFFKSKGVEVNQELYALSELIQWIWRSRIRDNQPINLYIPSKRMRTILIRYLNSDL
ncbi:hypothetical protein [Niallia circulans]|uniref:Uncharacterized protein n=1 Tax=Niallia circulans TaxID=1397 RepID=A0A941JEX1_NIACI|nr:hypothetical protein [Niallia circulans]MCB5235890.1 hypothetical protein [Niallia circulans]